MRDLPLVSVITASVGHSALVQCISSVARQTYPKVQHLVFADGPQASVRIANCLHEQLSEFPAKTIQVIDLPYSVGKDRWNGHRMYAAGSFLCEGEYVCFLDDDNFFDEVHIQSCIDAIRAGATWAYSFRKIIDTDGDHQCNDDCESLGKWPSVLGPDDYFIDANCYFLPRHLAVTIAPLWYRKFREPNQVEVDRALCQTLRKIAPNYSSNGRYSVNYRVGNTPRSVGLDFFKRGNAEMLSRFGGNLPWVAQGKA